MAAPFLRAKKNHTVAACSFLAALKDLASFWDSRAGSVSSIFFKQLI
jgi:hypothetical protein